MAKVIIYSRVSTEKQTLEQQERTVNEWLKSRGMTATHEITDEGVSGGVSYKDRNLGKVVIPMMERGDTLIVAELSRIGRSMSDINKFVNDEMKRIGARLVIVQMGLDLDCSKVKAIDEMILYAFGFAAQMEKELIQERTQSAIDVRKRKLSEDGSFISKCGRVCTKLGNTAEGGLERACAASAKVRTDRARNDANNIRIWKVVSKYATNGGMTRDQATKAAVELMNAGVLTPSGLPFTTKRARYVYHTMKNYMV